MKRARRALGAGSALSIALLGVVCIAPVPPAQAASALQCGATITTNTTLTADLGPCPSTAITFGADNITLNLNGHRVTGVAAGNGDTPGIVGSGTNGDTVENGTVSGFDTGVYFEFGTGETITHIYAHDNIGSLDGNGIFGEGIQLFQTNNTTISNNQVLHNGTFAGIDIFDSSGITISGNVVTSNNVLEPLSIHGGSPDGIQQDIGIWVVFLSIPTSNNSVLSNIVTGSGLDGIQISRFADSNTVARNTVANNGFGQVPGIRDGDGIVVFGNDNVVRNNTSDRNAAKGVRVFGGAGNQMLSNVAAGNGGGRNSAGIGFDIADTTTSPPCGTDVWSHNVFVTFNQPCVTH